MLASVGQVSDWGQHYPLITLQTYAAVPLFLNYCCVPVAIECHAVGTAHRFTPTDWAFKPIATWNRNR